MAVENKNPDVKPRLHQRVLYIYFLKSPFRGKGSVYTPFMLV